MIGACGANTKAMYERMQKRIELLASVALAVVTAAFFFAGELHRRIVAADG
jgi:hypothetical protein